MRTSIFKYRVLSLSLSLSLNGRPFSLSFSLFVPRYPFELWNHYIVWTTDAETCSHRTSYRNILKGTLVQTREKLQMLTFKQGNLAIHQRSTMKGQRPLHIFRFVVHPSSKFEERSRWRLNQLSSIKGGKIQVLRIRIYSDQRSRSRPIVKKIIGRIVTSNYRAYTECEWVWCERTE